MGEARYRALFLAMSMLMLTIGGKCSYLRAKLAHLVGHLPATTQILGSPFHQLYRQYGKEPKRFLEVAWVTGVFFLRTTGTVAEISRFELTLTGQSLAVDFIGRRKKEFSNRPAYEIKVQGTCDLGRPEK
jgi:hypothetical protein